MHKIKNGTVLAPFIEKFVQPQSHSHPAQFSGVNYRKQQIKLH